jgi:hypothetical protein
MENVSSREMICLLKTSRDLQTLFAAVTRLVEGLSLKTLLALKVEKSLICLGGTRRPTVSIIEQESILFFKTLIINKASRLTIQLNSYFLREKIIIIIIIIIAILY